MEFSEAMELARGFAKEHPEYEGREAKSLVLDVLEYIEESYTLTPKEQ